MVGKMEEYTMQRRRLLSLIVLALPAVTGWPGRSRAATAHKVDIRGFAFQPKSLDVQVGDTVTFTNRDSAPHTATASDKSWTTGTLNSNESGEITVAAGMEGAYFCRFHPGMKGKLAIAG